jgi:hypothetical protein
MGGVDGTHVNAEFLMQHKQHILVYPGGQREFLKHSSIPSYELLWKERMGFAFARLTIKYAYPIVPMAAVGVEDFWHTTSPVICRAGFPWGWWRPGDCKNCITFLEHPSLPPNTMESGKIRRL